MALVKRGKTWHCHFVVNGQRFRQSLGTKDWREAQSKEKELIGQAMEGKITQSSTSLARQPFRQAADDYEKARKLELAPASQAKEKQLLVQLRAYFQQAPLKSIAAKQVIDYRAWRAEQKVGPATLNSEIGILRRIMKRARSLGPYCRRYSPAARARNHRQSINRRRTATPSQNGCNAARVGNGFSRRDSVPQYHRARVRVEGTAMVGRGSVLENTHAPQVENRCGSKDCPSDRCGCIRAWKATTESRSIR